MADKDTTLRIAVIGAGPLGLEAGLYGRYLGYKVTIFEQFSIAEQFTNGPDLPIAFSDLVSNLGHAALKAQSESFSIPDMNPTSRQELFEQYLSPLASSDLLTDNIRENSVLKGITLVDDGSAPYQLIVGAAEEEEVTYEADVVIDTTRSLGPDGWVGDELPAASTCRRFAPDLFIANGCQHDPVGSTADKDIPSGRRQIRELFTVVADRENLDLYESVKNLL